MTREDAIKVIRKMLACTDLSVRANLTADMVDACHMAIKALEQEPKIKVLDRDEAIRKLGAVDIYQASAWITLLDDLEYLKLKICEVDNGNE